MARGGSRLGAGGQSKWKHGKTKTIRVPEALAEKILEYARNLDNAESQNYSKFEIDTVSNSNELISGIDERHEAKGIIEHVTESKTVNLSGISIKACNGKSAVYLEDLANAGYEILPERLGKMFKVILSKGLRK